MFMAKMTSEPTNASQSGRDIKAFPDPPVDFRTRGSRIRAMLRAIFGLGGGFFTQYDYIRDLQAVTQPYPEIEGFCEAAAFQGLLAEMQSHIPTYRQFGGSPGDPILGSGPIDVMRSI